MTTAEIRRAEHRRKPDKDDDWYAPQIILTIEQTPNWPRVRAGRYRWEPALQLVEFLPKGRHTAESRHVYLLTTKENTPRGALLKALRMEQKRVKELPLP